MVEYVIDLDEKEKEYTPFTITQAIYYIVELNNLELDIQHNEEVQCVNRLINFSITRTFFKNIKVLVTG